MLIPQQGFLYLGAASLYPTSYHVFAVLFVPLSTVAVVTTLRTGVDSFSTTISWLKPVMGTGWKAAWATPVAKAANIDKQK